MISSVLLPLVFIILANISGSVTISYDNLLNSSSTGHNNRNVNNIRQHQTTSSESAIGSIEQPNSSVLLLSLSSSSSSSAAATTTESTSPFPIKLSSQLTGERVGKKLDKFDQIESEIIELTTTKGNIRRTSFGWRIPPSSSSSTEVTTEVAIGRTATEAPAGHTTRIPALSSSSSSSVTSTITLSPVIVFKKFLLPPPSSSSFISFKDNDGDETSRITSVTTTGTTTTTRTTTPATTTTSETSVPTNGYYNITSQAGTHAYLPCNVKQFVKKPISWIRIRDGHILTVDQTTFIADQRFQSLFTENPERWSLQIKFVHPNDSGWYECQVSTEPKSSAKINLHIVEPQTRIIGESTRHVKAGSPVIIRCTISEALEPPLYINWFFNDKQIYLHNKNGWRTEIDREATINGNDKNITIASLIIAAVTKKDTGSYKCSPSNSESAIVVLHVLNGEYSASAITSSGTISWHRNGQPLTGYLQKIIIIIIYFAYYP